MSAFSAFFFSAYFITSVIGNEYVFLSRILFRVYSFLVFLVRINVTAPIPVSISLNRVLFLLVDKCPNALLRFARENYVHILIRITKRKINDGVVFFLGGIFLNPKVHTFKINFQSFC